MKRILLALALLFPIAASAQYVDGLPAATSVSQSDVVIVCQGGASGHPGTCTTRQATVSQVQTSAGGVSCTGTPSAEFAVTSGVVTHC